MRKLLFCVASGAFIVTAYSSPVYAQNAQIMGKVTDSSGGVMPGVTVTAQNESSGLARTEATDAGGNYRLEALPIPGPYKVTVQIQGFNIEAREHVALSIDQTATLDFVLKPATVTESVTVSGGVPVVDVTTASIQTALTTQQMQDLPVAARRWMDMAMLTPGTSQDSIRGQFYRGNVSVGAGATNFYSTGNLVDGVSNTWAAMGEPRQNFPMDAIEQFQVSVSTYKAEYSLATGGIVNVVTKSGTNAHHFGAFLFHRNKALTAKQYFQTSNPSYLRNQEGGTIGGPVIKNRLHYFFTFERTDENVFNTVNTPAWPQYSGTYKSEQYRWTYLGRSDLQISPAQSLFARFAKEYEYRPELTVGGSVIPSASFDFSVPRTSFVVGHTWIINPRVLNDLRFNYAYAKYEVTPPSSHGGWDPGYFGPDRTKWCTPTFNYPSLRVGGCGSSQMGSDHRIEVKDNISYGMDLAGRHEWKAGFDVFYNPLDNDTIGNLLGTWTFPLDRPYNPTDPTTFPTQYTQAQPSYSELPTWYYGLFVQDDWQPLPSLTLNLGFRYDQQPGAYGDTLDKNLASTAEVLGPQAGQFPLPIPFIDVAARGHVKNYGPRIGVAWDPLTNGRMNVHMSWGIYYDHMRGYPGKGEIEWPQAQSIVISRPAFPDPLQGQSRDVYLSTAAPNIAVTANDMRNPYSHPITVGITREFTQGLGLTADFTYVHRFADNNGPTLDINLPDPVTRLRPYPQFGRVSVYSSNMETTYRALFLKFDKRLSNRWSALVSYTLSSAHDVPVSNVQGGVYGFVPVDGYSTADRRHVLRASATVLLPWNSQVSAIVDLRTSQTFNPATTLDINRDGYTIDLPPGVGFNSGCRDLNLDAVNAFRATSGLPAVTSVACPSYQDIGLKFSKSIPFRNHRVELIAQLFNIMNRANFAPPTANPLSATFGKVNQIAQYINAPSRQAEVAIRFQF